LALLFAAGVGLLAIVISSNDASQQLGVMQRQLDEMQAEQRPWVKWADIAPDGPIERVGDELRTRLSYRLHSVGKKPAVGVLF